MKAFRNATVASSMSSRVAATTTVRRTAGSLDHLGTHQEPGIVEGQRLDLAGDRSSGRRQVGEGGPVAGVG